jgi:hypothetical protein
LPTPCQGGSLSGFVGVRLSAAVFLAVPGFLLVFPLDICASSCYSSSMVSLVVSWFFLLFLLLSLVCWVGFLLSVSPVLVLRPPLLCLRLRLFVRLFPVLVVACRLGAPVVSMRRYVVLLLVLVPCSFFLRLPPGLLVLVRWVRWLCARLLVFVLLLAAVVACWSLFLPGLVLLVSVPVVRFVGAVRVRGVRRPWLLVWGGVSLSGCLPVSFLRLGLVFPGLLWSPGGGSVLLSLPRRCSCLSSSFVGRAAPVLIVLVRPNQPTPNQQEVQQ